ncbi:hypothetical protein ACHAXT_001731 [Thalassiosira profunda]
MWRRKRPYPAADGGRWRAPRLPALGAVLALSFLAVFWDDLSSPLYDDSLRKEAGYSVGHRVLQAASSEPTAGREMERKLYVPPSLDTEGRERLLAGNGGVRPDAGKLDMQDPRPLMSSAGDVTTDPEGGARQRERKLSLNLGNGNCKWQPPTYEVPEEIDFQKTLVAGYPSGDKRMVFLQMEALSGWPAKDEWDFAYGGDSNHPFIKANYPHHEGIWGWGTNADQVVLVVPNVRRSMVEYHDILFDIEFETTWEVTSQLGEMKLNDGVPTVAEYLGWRDSHVMTEILEYGWHIDYWMEGGLLRDVFTHELTTKEHWDDLVSKPYLPSEELDIGNYVANGTTVEATYDPHCESGGDISGGCVPVAIISADHLKTPGATGRAETNAIANALTNDVKTGQYVIAAEAWGCIWRELMEAKKGAKTMEDRPGYANKKADGYNFSAEMLEAMVSELERLIGKYSGPEWAGDARALRLVDILTEHLAEIQTELDEVNSGARMLGEHDFLGPNERARQRTLKKGREENADENEATDPSSQPWHYFAKLEQKRFENKRRDVEFAGPSKTRKLSRREREKQRKLSSTEESMSDEEFVAVLSQLRDRVHARQVEGRIDGNTQGN